MAQVKGEISQVDKVSELLLAGSLVSIVLSLLLHAVNSACILISQGTHGEAAEVRAAMILI